jgi:hypothetical protein
MRRPSKTGMLCQRQSQTIVRRSPSIEFAHICELEIKAIVQPEYQKTVDVQPAFDVKFQALADAHKELIGLVRSRLLQAPNPVLNTGAPPYDCA